MGEIHTNDKDMWAVKWIEVKQPLKDASPVSIAWVSKVGLWGMGGDMGIHQHSHNEGW